MSFTGRTKNNPTLLGRLLAWREARLAHRIAFAALSLSLLLGAVISVISYLALYSSIQSRVAGELESQSHLLRQRIEFDLNTLIQDTAAVARAPFVINGLLDAEGRRTYLEPFLRGHKVPVSIRIELNLVSLAGWPLVPDASPELAALIKSEAKFFSDVINTGRADVLVANRNGASLAIVAHPVGTPLTQSYEGALVAMFDLQEMFQHYHEQLSGQHTLSFFAKEIRVFEGRRDAAGSLIENATPLMLTTPLDELALELRLGTNRLQAYSPLIWLTAIYAGLALLFFYLVTRLARRMADDITQPLARLSATASAIAGGAALDARVTAAGHDEVAQLGRTFNRMLEQLEASQHALEQRVAERTAELRETQHRLSSILGEVRDVIWTATPDLSRFTYANEATNFVCGRPPQAFLDDPGLFWAIVPEDDHPIVSAASKELRNHGESSAVHRLMLPDGTTRWVLARTRLIRDEAGKVIRCDGIVSDITEQKRAESELIAAKNAAEEASLAKSQFLSSMSHELRTPLNAILGFAQLLQLEPGFSAEQMEMVEQVFNSGEHLLNLVNEVLDLSRIEAGRLDLSIESVPLGRILEECHTLLMPLAQKQGILLDSLPQQADGLLVRADNVRLKQVLINLLSNAVKYNREGGHVGIGLVESDGICRIEVRDTGIGISSENMARLFLPFERLGVQSRLSVDGTGIGLTISKRLVEMMGGEIGAESAIGLGSTFWVSLPYAGREDHGLQSDATGAGPLSKAGGGTILYIEDNPANLKLVSMLLAKHTRLDLRTAHEPGIGLALAASARPDLILLDINLPHMDGYEVLTRLRGNPELAAIPVIAVSANAMPRDIERGLAAGFDDYLAKPFNVDNFLDTIARHIGNEGLHGQA